MVKNQHIYRKSTKNWQGILASFIISLSSPAYAVLSFANRSDVLGVDQIYDGGWNHFVGGGVAVFDCNADHFPDFYAAGGSAPSRLFVNTSRPLGDIAFRQAEIAAIDDVTGAYPLDIDSDGILDLVVLTDGPNQILRGQGDCTFVAAPQEWNFTAGHEWTTSFSATFERGQSWPTLAMGNYVDETNPNGPFEACDENYLIRPNGHSFGPRIPLTPGFCALSMLFSDWKRSGQVDLRISNDRQYYVFNGREQMWHLDPLSEYTADEGWGEMKLWGMGIASRDITGDGLPEVMLTSMGDQMLQINQGGGVMKTAPYEVGTFATTPFLGDDGRPSTGWHAEFGDVNNDGLDDLFMTKGNVDQMPSNAIHDPNNLLIQKPDGTFTEMAGAVGLATMDRSRGAAVVDLNLDGLLDIVVVNRRAPMEIWQNSTTDAGHWVEIDLLQRDVNVFGVGSFVQVRLDDGRILTQEVTVGGGHASGESGSHHFGIGDQSTADVRITWPDGTSTDWETVGANQILLAERDKPMATVNIGQ